MGSQNKEKRNEEKFHSKKYNYKCTTVHDKYNSHNLGLNRNAWNTNRIFKENLNVVVKLQTVEYYWH